MTTITLKKPVEFDGKTYSSIEVDEPTVGGIEAFETAKAAGKTDVTATIAMLAIDTGMPEAALRKIRATDLALITEAIAPFVDPKANGGTGAA